MKFHYRNIFTSLSIILFITWLSVTTKLSGTSNSMDKTCLNGQSKYGNQTQI